MPDTGLPGNVWFPDDTAPVAPLEGLFSQQATSINLALASMGSANYPAKSDMDAVPGTLFGQRANVYNDVATPTNNGPYYWNGTAWVFDGVILANVTPATGWTAGTGPNVPRLLRQGRQVTVYGSLSWAGGGTYANMFTVPVGFLPPNLSAQRQIGVGAQLTGTSIISFMAVLNTTGIMGNGTGSTGSLPASGAVHLNGLSWAMD